MHVKQWSINKLDKNKLDKDNTFWHSFSITSSILQKKKNPNKTDVSLSLNIFIILKSSKVILVELWQCKLANNMHS